jgi:S-DNA-T family DNA segregation ATPase FtsK/SpoIIIE
MTDQNRYSESEPPEFGPFVVDHDPDRDDAETVDETAPAAGGPVDPAPGSVSWVDLTSIDGNRLPVIPGWLRSPAQRQAALRSAADVAGYHVAYRAVRLPLYVGKVMFWAPVGAARILGRAVHWARAEHGNWALRQHAASRGDSETWIKLDTHRERQSSWRWPVLGAGVLGVAAAEAGLHFLGPATLQVLADFGTAVLLARFGRPADKPIIDRITPTRRFTRLTGEMVRTSLCQIGLTGVKDPGQIKFPQDIHRDGPGYLARVNLPGGVEAVDVLERRGRLSSALRLPVDQVWPSAGPEHAGQLDLWVGYKPASQMGQPTWALTAPSARTSVFEAFEFGTDERQRPIKTVLFERNFLIGGAPGSGKSYAARCLAIGAALDPLCEMKIAEFKGTADFGDLAPSCSTYACGVDDEAFAAGASILAWGLAECERRGKRIRAARERGEAPQGKVTPELARKPGSGLHSVFILLDEVHELFADPKVGKQAAQDAERLIKRGRALGIIVVLATQIPDKTSLPPNITRCVTVRWCLAVQDQVANDMILGTGAYKRGLTATAYRPGADAGWGIITGLAKPGPVRSFFPDAAATGRIIGRIGVLRGNQVPSSDAPTVVRDAVADVRVVWPAAQPGAHWDVLAERLAEQWPESYGQWTPAMLRDALKLAGIPTQDVKTIGVDGERAVRKGCRLEHIDQIASQRAVKVG